MYNEAAASPPSLTKATTMASSTTTGGMTTVSSSPPPLVTTRIPSHIQQIVHVGAGHKKLCKLWRTLQLLQQATVAGIASSSSQPPMLSSSTSRHDGAGGGDGGDCRRGLIFFAKIRTPQSNYQWLCKQQPSQPKQQPPSKFSLQFLVLHSQLPQREREQVWLDFCAGTTTSTKPRGGSRPSPASSLPRTIWLLTTDLCARGVLCDDVDYAIQFDFPGNLETYLHRCGRVGRNAITHTNLPSSSPQAHPAQTAVVYSFLTRNLQALAPDLLSLLEAHDQHAWIDPNLRTLAAEAVAAANKPKSSKPPNRKEKNMDDEDQHGNNNNDDATHIQHYDHHATAGTNEESEKATVNNRHDDDNNNNNDNNKQKAKRKRKKRPRHERNQRPVDDDDDEEKVWAADRIVLQRAAHISDASSSSSDDDDK